MTVGEDKPFVQVEFKLQLCTCRRAEMASSL